MIFEKPHEAAAILKKLAASLKAESKLRVVLTDGHILLIHYYRGGKLYTVSPSRIELYPYTNESYLLYRQLREITSSYAHDSILTHLVTVPTVEVWDANPEWTPEQILEDMLSRRIAELADVLQHYVKLSATPDTHRDYVTDLLEESE